MGCRALVFSTDLDSGNAPEVIPRMLAWPINQKVALFIDQVVPVKLAHLEVRRQLNGVRRAGFLAIAAKDAAREVDTEELRIPPPVLVLRRLQSDATDRTGDRAQVASHTAFPTVGIARKNDPAAVARREIRLLLRILHGNPLLEGVEKYVPDGSKYAEHSVTPRYDCCANQQHVDQGQRQHYLPAPGHKLIESRARQSAPHQNKDCNEEE